jgi:hypothetical protein
MASGAPAKHAARPVRRWSGRGLLGLGSGLTLLVFWGLVALRLHAHAENHLGVSVLSIIPLALVAMLTGALGWAPPWRRAGLALLLLGLLTLAGAVLLERFNVLVEYNTWLEGGMPERPF